MDMNRKSIIEEMYVEATCRAELVKPKDEKYAEKTAEKNSREDKLYQSLNEEQQRLFEVFLESYQEVLMIHEKEVYRQGVSLGIKITAEAFLA